MDSIKIQIPSLTENIRIIESFIDNAKEKFSLDDDIYGNIMIAVTESVNNAIKHGNNNDNSKNVSLSLSLNENIIKFIIEENLDKPGGRGIFLMKHLSDEVNFKDNGRVVELTFYFN